jgi:transient receptor potential cation channel subfamily A protein 1
LASIILIYSVLRLIFEGIQLAISLYQACSSLQCGTQFCWDLLGAVKEINYFWSLMNWVEVPLFILSIIFSSVILHKQFCLLAWQWQIGVGVLWLSWIEFIFLSTQFQLIGVHALMFIRVLKTILKFIPLALLLMIAFGLTFHFLLYQPEFMV